MFSIQQSSVKDVVPRCNQAISSFDATPNHAGHSTLGALARFSMGPS